MASPTGTNDHTHPSASHVSFEAGNGRRLSYKVTKEEAADQVDLSEHSVNVEDRETEAVESSSSKKSKTVLPMLALCMAAFLGALDQTIVATALPVIAVELSATQADFAWVGSTYLLGSAASMPAWGKVSDIFGRKPILLFANVVFLAGSLICALSINMGMLQAGRVLQGIGSGGLLTLANICISDMFSMRERGVYMGIIGLVYAFASAIGPVLGGVFTEYVTWRWCFYINLPVDGITFILIALFLKLHTPKTPLMAGLKAIDWLGLLLVVGSTVMFLMALAFGGVSFPWNSPTVVCLLVFGLACFGLFAIVEARFAKYPVMPLRILRQRSNVAALVATCMHGLVFISSAYFLPLYFQAVLGATPLLSGVYVLPCAVTLSLVITACGILIRKTGRVREVIWFGFMMMTLGFGLFIDLPSYASWARVIIYQLIAGVGIGCLFQSPLVALQSHVAPADMGTATGAFGFARQISTAMSVIVGGAIFQNQVTTNAEATQLPPNVRDALAGGKVGSSTGLAFTLPPSEKAAVLNIYESAFRTMWIFYTALAAFGFLVSFRIARKELDTQHQATQTGLAAEEANRLAHAEAKQDEEATHQVAKSQ